jgi:hypothetical protein
LLRIHQLHEIVQIQNFAINLPAMSLQGI